ADQTAALLTGFSQVLGGLAVLTGDPTRRRRQGYRFEIHVPDWLPPIVNGGRAFATILAMEVFWIYSGWPNGASAITFAAISILLLSPRSDEAYPVAVKMTVGTTLSAMAAALMLFAGLPHVARFAGFGLLLGLYLVPVGALVALPWQPAVFTPMAANFIPLLAPANQMSYDATHFFNAATAIVIGCGAAALALRLMPPLSAELRARRLLLLSLRDLRRLAKDPQSWTGGWEARLVARIAALPEEAEPVQRAVLVTALAAGRSIIALDESAPSLGIAFRMQAAFGSFSRGNSTDALSHLDCADQQLAQTIKSSDLNVLASHARGYILAIRDALIDHRSYFETGEAA
ncbi:MAG: FUSC family protein, partial [Candidatus Eremiobacteraeota bacterium]|nr:FUSC family protein [Candidatus Eremiobacteraeota bacterium]